MAAPNLLAATTWKSDTAIQLCTTSLVDLTWPIGSVTAVATGHVHITNAIYAANKHASQAAYVTIIHKKSSTEYELVPRVKVNPGQILNLTLGRNENFAEGDKMRIKADIASAIHIFVPYDDVS